MSVVTALCPPRGGGEIFGESVFELASEDDILRSDRGDGALDFFFFSFLFGIFFFFLGCCLGRCSGAAQPALCGLRPDPEPPASRNSVGERRPLQ